MRFGSPALLIGLGALALAGAAAITLAPRFGGRQPPRFVVVTLGAERLALLSAYLRPNARQGGAIDALDLAAFFPDFSPAGDVGDVNARTDLAERFARTVFVTAKAADFEPRPGRAARQALPALPRREFLEPSRRARRAGVRRRQPFRRRRTLLRRARGARIRRPLPASRPRAQDAEHLHLRLPARRSRRRDALFRGAARPVGQAQGGRARSDRGGAALKARGADDHKSSRSKSRIAICSVKALAAGSSAETIPRKSSPLFSSTESVFLSRPTILSLSFSNRRRR